MVINVEDLDKSQPSTSTALPVSPPQLQTLARKKNKPSAATLYGNLEQLTKAKTKKMP